jgi:glutathione S-transferase
MMRLIGLLDSPYVRRVAISLDMMGLPFRHERLSVFRNYDAFSAINPVVKAPTLVTDEGIVLMDSSLILDHLEQLAPPERRLSPAGLKVHARCQHLAGLALAACEKAVQLVYERNLRPPEKQHRPWIDRVEAQLRAACRLLEDDMPQDATHQDGRWLVDDQPRQADVTVAVTWTFTQRALDALILPEAHPRLSQFAARVETLPAFTTYPYE